MGGFEDKCNEKNTREKRYCDALFNFDGSISIGAQPVNNQALGQMFKSKNSVPDI